MIDPRDIATWKERKNYGMVSSVGEYTPEEFWEVLEAYEKLVEAIRDIKAAFDWYHADEYDRCSSVPQDAIEDAMKLVAQPADLKAQAAALFK